ncbi:sensor histidine kinase [Pararhizobium sp. DWP1-1-3]|uniref:sensor histidine kinase n=1 Tax=Pararhizobium sp. DWP1-1-3 TaxID=2804652 RepID=UPI003CF293F5
MVQFQVDPSIVPSNEASRMAAVRRYDILDTPPDGMFDRVTAMAARLFDVPIAIVSIVDTDRIWFKSHHGVPVKQIDRDPGLCASAILGDDPYILENAAKDVRSLANPLVAGEFGLRFYAAVPLRTLDGYNLGTLCIIDKQVRAIDQKQIDDLKDLASVVMDHLELRLSAQRAIATSKMLAKEIDHRVMNSLQFVSSMLTMQGKLPHASQAVAELKDAANRVAAVARVHRHAYAQDVAGDMLASEYLGRLCEDISGIVSAPVQLVCGNGMISHAFIQPIGLIVNELVMNAVKHGAGPITVSYHEQSGMQELAVSDRGKGLPDDFDVSQSLSGLGMRVVRALSAQLGGQLNAANAEGNNGTRFSVRFPAASRSGLHY